MDSDIDELSELLLLAADEGEIELAEKTTQPSSTTSASQKSGKAIQTTSGTNKSSKSINLAEDAFDSSDEEDLKSFIDRKYTEYGRDINLLLKKEDQERKDVQISRDVNKMIRTSSSKQQTRSLQLRTDSPAMIPKTLKQQTNSLELKKENINVYTDPVFGIRIVQPLISSAMMQERMVGRTPVDVRNLQWHIDRGELSKDWCLGGVIVSKGAVQTSQKGAQYVVWKISDLKGEIKQVSMFLFKNAYKDLWKTAVGTVVAILNPSILPKRDGNNDISLSIDNPLRVMILGKSKDFGNCKAKKKNGDPCNAIVNLDMCEYCIYHVKQEYGKLCGRSELQSPTAGRGLQSLRNKVLGKSEVFYAGKSFVAEPSVKNKKLIAKDQQRLQTLSDVYKSTSRLSTMVTSNTTLGRVSRIAETMESNVSQRSKDLERLKMLKASMPSTSSDLNAAKEVSSTSILDAKPKTPTLSRDSFSFTLVTDQSAKAKAIELLKKKPIEKINPNFIKYRGTASGKKRAIEALSLDDEETDKKRKKLEDEVAAFKNERIQKILQAKSAHTDLIESHEASVQDAYFNKLEKKEAMEEKMVNTMRVECKAVICLQCKYKAFKAADRCKEERHQLKVMDAEKRFYECEDCGNRTVTLFRIPKTTCSNCEGSRWKRTGMIRDKSNVTAPNSLSIRGDEEVFLGSVTSKGNVNLCVAET